MKNVCLASCRSCCKFKADEKYFSPKVTDQEIARIKLTGLYKNIFYPFKNSSRVFQISLIKSKFVKGVWVCPWLDEKTQACKIYRVRPFDCKFWPFMLMFNRDKTKVLLAHVNQEECSITKAMSKIKFKAYLKASLKKNIVKLISKYPDLIWDYEPNTFVVKEVKLS